MKRAIRPVGYVAGWGLVDGMDATFGGTGIDGQSRSFDVMTISRPDGFGEIANLGLTLAEAKLLLAQVQQQVVGAQAHHHAMFRPDCQSCGERYHAKGWRPHRIATLFGDVRV